MSYAGNSILDRFNPKSLGATLGTVQYCVFFVAVLNFEVTMQLIMFIIRMTMFEGWNVLITRKYTKSSLIMQSWLDDIKNLCLDLDRRLEDMLWENGFFGQSLLRVDNIQLSNVQQGYTLVECIILTETQAVINDALHRVADIVGWLCVHEISYQVLRLKNAMRNGRSAIW